MAENNLPENAGNEAVKYGKLAYCLLAFFLGGLGIHSFYAKKWKEGVAFIVITAIVIVLSFIGGLNLENPKPLFAANIISLLAFGYRVYQIVVAIKKPADEFGRISD